MNQCQLMGRLTRDPELRHTSEGTPVTTFSLAVDRQFNKDKSDFIDIVAWRTTAEFCAKYFQKGARIAVVGSIQTRSWEDKDGKNRRTMEVIADRVYFADSKKGDYKAESAATEAVTGGDYIPDGFEEYEDDSEIPF